jgi:crotonobetainyl-CoA:carnitine CoA-transferase CaiB-like acyl-CoA transferase
MTRESQRDTSWRGPLADIRVLDLTRVLAGPFATQILGDLGAEILKVEAPGKGDDIRAIAPFATGGESHYFLALNRNKKSLVIDLKTERGVGIVKSLAAKSDVVVENFRPGVMEKLGLGYAALSAVNPRLVMCSISGFGQTGPLKDTPSYDIVTQAYSGAMSVNGEADRSPVKLGIPLGDMAGGVFGAPAILAALHERGLSGHGRHIDISLMDGLMGMLGYLAQIYFLTGESPKRVGSGHPNIAPYGAYPASDGHVIVACLNEGFWRRFASALGREDLVDDPRFADRARRVANRLALDEIIGELMCTRSKSEWSTVLQAHDVPCAPILDVGDSLEHPQTLARAMVETVEHPTAGSVRLVGRPIKFSGAEQVALAPPPVLGADTREVLGDLLAMDSHELDRLAAAGVIDAVDRSDAARPTE